MTARHYQDLIAWQLAESFKDEVFKIVLASPDACRDLRYCSQVLEAASAIGKDVAEGFLRFSPATFIRFLDYSAASLVEAERRLHDGHQRRFFEQSSCTEAFKLGRRCLTAIIRLKQSQVRYLNQRPPKRRSRHPRQPKDRTT
jgi:four helix bundle protein